MTTFSPSTKKEEKRGWKKELLLSFFPPRSFHQSSSSSSSSSSPSPRIASILQLAKLERRRGRGRRGGKPRMDLSTFLSCSPLPSLAANSISSFFSFSRSVLLGQCERRERGRDSSDERKEEGEKREGDTIHLFTVGTNSEKRPMSPSSSSSYCGGKRGTGKRALLSWYERSEEVKEKRLNEKNLIARELCRLSLSPSSFDPRDRRGEN